MNDTLKYFSSDPIHRKYEHNKLTFSLLYAFTENFVLPFSHDEVVHGKNSLLHKMPGDMWQQFANLRLLYAYQYAHPGKEIALHGPGIRAARRMDRSPQPALAPAALGLAPRSAAFRRRSEPSYAAEPALHQVDFDWHGFEWIDGNDGDNSALSFIRRGKRREISWWWC